MCCRDKIRWGCSCLPDASTFKQRHSRRQRKGQNARCVQLDEDLAGHCPLPRSRPVTSICVCRRTAVTASASSDQASQSLAAAQHSVAQLLYTLSDVSATAAASDAATAATDAATYTAKRYTGWFSTLADYLETVLNYLQACRLQNTYKHAHAG